MDQRFIRSRRLHGQHLDNGLRIVVLDMFPALWKYNREAMWVQWAVFLPMFLLPAALMIMRVQI